MLTKELITGLTIHLIIPLLGLLSFLRLKKQMTKEKTQDPPTSALFILFATYGGLLLVTLTTLFWQWSGMASLGTFYLILGAPIAMGFMAHRYRKIKASSKYHHWIYISSLSYFIIAPLTISALFLIFKN